MTSDTPFSQKLMGNKIAFYSLGCPRNRVDTEVMLGILLQAGMEPEEDLKEADYIVINTCGFLQSARDESVKTIRRVLAQRKPTAKVLVAGCMVQEHREEVKKRVPEVDYLLGSGDVESILKVLQEEEAAEYVSTARSYLEQGEIPRQLSTPQHYAYLKIAEGCRKRCSFCIIPRIKGPLKSKSIERVVEEFKALLDQGVQEIILIAQDLGDYGKDWGLDGGFVPLLKEMLKDERDFWIRLLYVYPDEIDDSLVELMAQDSRIVPYLDMPIQHVSDSVLKRMRRRTNRADIERTISSLRKALPDVTIRTSLMVGFPGETDEDFQELLEFVKAHRLQNVGVFKFSPEKGAAASKMEGQVSEKVKNHRYQKLMKAQQKISKSHGKSLVGKRVEVIVEGYHPETDLFMVGRHAGQCPEIDGQVILNDHRLVEAFGERYTVEITESGDYDLVGSVVA